MMLPLARSAAGKLTLSPRSWIKNTLSSHGADEQWADQGERTGAASGDSRQLRKDCSCAGLPANPPPDRIYLQQQRFVQMSQKILPTPLQWSRVFSLRYTSESFRIFSSGKGSSSLCLSLSHLERSLKKTESCNVSWQIASGVFYIGKRGKAEYCQKGRKKWIVRKKSLKIWKRKWKYLWRQKKICCLPQNTTQTHN